jgi:dTDP-4-dehydrorhamnose 3,5-epimerase
VKFEECEIEGAYVVHLEERSDERGFFARAFCADEFTSLGLDPTVVQCNLSYNHRQGTLRGMHWQAHPFEEVKYIRCIRGRIFDVLVDIRPFSSTYLRWTGVELSADNRLGLYAPKGTAHGYLTLEDGCEVLYQVSQRFTPEADRGARWNDPAFAITWPFEPAVISTKDAQHPDFVPG